MAIKFLNSTNTDSGVLYVDATNNRVGIGTTTPSRSLSVESAASSVMADFKYTAGGFSSIILSNTNGSAHLASVGNDFLISPAGTERMRVTSAGNVGIGTTSPSQKLEVSFDASVYGARFTRNDAAGSSLIEFANNTGVKSIVGYDAGVDGYRIGTPTANNLTVKQSGNVGIGTTNPTSKLNIVSTSNDQDALTVQDDARKIKIGRDQITVTDLSDTATQMYINPNANVSINSTAGNTIIGGSSMPNSAKLAVMGTVYVADSANPTTSVTRLVPVSNGGNALLKIKGGNFIHNVVYETGWNNFQYATLTSSYNGSDTDFLLSKSDTSGNTVANTKISTGTSYFNNTLGIATTGPYTGAKLHVSAHDTSPSLNGTVPIDITAIFSNSDVAYGTMFATDSSGKGYIQQRRTDAATYYDLLVQPHGGNVGIGTTSPGEKLHVYHATTNILAYLQSGDADAILAMADNGGSVRIQNTSGNLRFLTGGTASTSGSNTSEVMRITSSNVGIGTASPSEKLHVSGNVRIEGDLTVNGSYTQIDTDVNTTEQWNVTNDGTGPAVTINQKGAQDIMDVQDDGTSVFYIEDGGNVGIGTTDPTSNLHIAGSNSNLVKIQSSSGEADILYSSGATGGTEWQVGTGYSSAPGGAGSFFFYQGGGTKLAVTTGGGLSVPSYGSGTKTGTAAYALAVDSSGNVIETAVQGSPTGGSGTAGKITKWDTSSTLTDSVITESSGNIGIGTTSPAFTLDVNGKIRVGTVTSQSPATLISRRNGANIEFGHGNTTSGYYGTIGVQGNNGQPYFALSAECESSVNTFTTRGFKGNVITTDGAGSLMFTQLTSASATGQSLTERMRIDSSGNVGIGTTTILGNATKLHVKVDDSNTDFSLGSPWHLLIENDSVLTDTGAMLGLRANNADGGISVHYGGAVNTGYMVFHLDAGGAANGERMRITSNGNVGIGTTTPTSRLHTYGSNVMAEISSGADSGIFAIGNNTSNGQGSSLTWDDGIGYAVALTFGQVSDTAGYRSDRTHASIYTTNVGPYGKADLAFATKDNDGGLDPVEKMRITSAGNVGIGTTSPSFTSGSGLEIQRAGTATLRLDSGSFATELRAYTDGAFLGQLSASYLDLGTNNSTRVRIDSAGNVGIGTTSPDAPLHVAPASDFKVLKLGDDLITHYKITGAVSHVLTLTCGSYYQAEVVITANQTNSGGYNNLYIRGIWSNNHTSHHWDVLEEVGYLTGSSFDIVNGQNDVSNSGKLVINHNYSSASFAGMTVRVTDMYGTHSYTIA